MAPRYAPPIRAFADFWRRAQLPPAERLHAIIAWNTAIEATCQVLAERLPSVTVEQLRELAKDLKGVHV